MLYICISQVIQGGWSPSSPDYLKPTTMNKEFKILIIESSRFKVLLDAAIEGLEGKSPLTNEKLATYLQNRINDIEKEIQEIKQQS